MMIKKISMLTICMFFLILPVLESAGADYEVATDYWPPFRQQGNNGKLRGYDIDLMREIGLRMDSSFSFVRYPWSRCLDNMKTGRSDLMTGLAKTAEREQYMLYTDISYHQCNAAFYMRAGRGSQVKSYDDLSGLIVGYTRDSAYFEPFDSDNTLMKVAVADEKTLIRMTRRGRLDAFVGTDCQVLTDIRQMGLEDEIESTDYAPDAGVKLYIGVSRQSELAARMDELNQALEDAVQSGVIQRLDNRYFP